MIRLLGVISQGGIPIQWRTSLKSEGKLFITGLIEVTKRLSSMFGSGEVQMLEFEEDKLLVTESEKGFTVIALVSKAEEHLKSLIRIIAEDLDESDIQEPGGSLNASLAKQVDSILDRYLETEIDIEFSTILASQWEPILNSIKQNKELVKPITKLDQLFSEVGKEEKAWLKFERKTKGTIQEALSYTLSGAFDSACAVAMDFDAPLAKMLAIKTGLLALSMIRTEAPPLSVLNAIAETLSDPGNPFTELIKAAVEYRTHRVSLEEYFGVFRKASEQFQFGETEPLLINALLFVDPVIARLPEFCLQMKKYFEPKSKVIYNYLSNLLEQSNIRMFYSIPSYDKFKNTLGIWKTRIKNTLRKVAEITRPGMFQMQYLRKETELRELGIIEALGIQTFLELNTALVRSNILTLSERKGVLSEIIKIYREYFHGIFRISTPIFSETIQSVFQSVSVAIAEYFLLVTGKERAECVNQMKELLHDVVSIITNEWLSRQVDPTPLFSITNALCPILTMADHLFNEEIQLTYLVLNMTKEPAIEMLQRSNPQRYAVILGCILNTFAALSLKTLKAKNRTLVLQKNIEALIKVHKYLLSQCLICRDDIITATYIVSQMLDELPKNRQEPLIKAVVALNRVVVPNLDEHGYDAAVIGGPLINLLVKSWQLLGNEEYYRQTKRMFEAAVSAWRKYGFSDKATEFEEAYTQLFSPPA
jgi:hypothetical protein